MESEGHVHADPGSFLGAGTKFVVLTVVVGFFGCTSLYYGAMEKLGYAKRDILVTRVKDARDSQKAARDEFKSALDEFTALVGSPGGELERKYTTLRSALERSEARAAEVKQRIAAVEEVSGALFKEWKRELKQYKNQKLRSQSERSLERTEDQYENLINAMHAAERRLEPVLQPLRDNVLFLKHNLNARAVGSLDQELNAVEESVDELLLELNRSISEAEEFINALPDGG